MIITKRGAGRKPMTRSRARPGDIIAVTGTLGNPAAGFYSLGTDIEADTNSEELISISSDGNVTLKNELEKGATYVITLDITNGKTAAKVSLNKK